MGAAHPPCGEIFEEPEAVDAECHEGEDEPEQVWPEKAAARAVKDELPPVDPGVLREPAVEGGIDPGEGEAEGKAESEAAEEPIEKIAQSAARKF